MVTLVTGHSGFLGHHIVAELRRSGHAVTGAGRPDLEIPSAQFDRLCERIAPQLIVHCAGPASVPASLTDPASDRDGAQRSLDGVLAAATGARLVLISTAAVYGEPESLPIHESVPKAPISPYGRHRAECELIALAAGVPLVILRVFSAYGEGLRRQVLWDISRQALVTSEVTLAGTGAETRDFVHARDVAAAVVCVAERASFEGELINVATGVETSIHRLAEIIVDALGVDASISFTGRSRAGDPTRWRADISRLRALGFEPEVPIVDGAGAYARWARTVL